MYSELNKDISLNKSHGFERMSDFAVFDFISKNVIPEATVNKVAKSNYKHLSQKEDKVMSMKLQGPLILRFGLEWL